MTAVEAPDEILAATRAWLEKIVIGLNLCPFAQTVHAGNRIRYVVSEAQTTEALAGDLAAELQTLVAADPAMIETTLLIHPHVLTEFDDYNDFLDIADATAGELGFTGVMQIASFHPRYHFAGTAPDAIENYTNRSPYPMLHLLREASVGRAVSVHPDVAGIPGRNIDTMNRLGLDGWLALMSRK